jgi:hypothetical protein
MNRFLDLFEKWHPYWDWECFKYGMWESRKKDMNKIQQASSILSDEVKCRQAMIGAVNAYPISAEQHLSKHQGKRPWIGQAACCFACGATEEETRIAWNFYMTSKSQEMANRVADEVIDLWTKNLS